MLAAAQAVFSVRSRTLFALQLASLNVRERLYAYRS